MADVTITAANVRPTATTQIEPNPLQAGEAIDAGETAYLAADGKYYLSDCDDSSTKAAVRVFAMTNAGTDEYFLGAKSGPVVVGGTLTEGQPYYGSGTAGKICPSSDLTTGDYPTKVGNADSTTVLDFQPSPASTAIA